MAIIFKQEWTKSEFAHVKKVFTKYVNSRLFNSQGGRVEYINKSYKQTFTSISNILGLAYTSSSLFACYSICNTSLYFDLHNKYTIEFVVLDDKNNVYLVLWDKYENELIVNI